MNKSKVYHNIGDEDNVYSSNASTAYQVAISGDMDGALRLLDWKRHCFYVKGDYEREVMAKVFE